MGEKMCIINKRKILKKYMKDAYNKRLPTRSIDMCKKVNFTIQGLEEIIVSIFLKQ